MKALVCFKCKEGIYIFENNPIRQNTESIFRSKHSEHPFLIVDINEVDFNFKILTEKDIYPKKHVE